MGGAVRCRNQMQFFRDVIDECDLLELGFVGPNFIWSKHLEDGHSTWDILDRGLVTNNWFLKFPGIRVTHLSCYSSNHLPLLVNPTSLEISPKNKIFRFEECGCLMLDVGKLWRLHGLQQGVWIIQGLFFRKHINVARTTCGGIKTVLAMFHKSWKRRKEFWR